MSEVITDKETPLLKENHRHKTNTQEGVSHQPLSGHGTIQRNSYGTWGRKDNEEGGTSFIGNGVGKYVKSQLKEETGKIRGMGLEV